jgi:hypothetical protein
MGVDPDVVREQLQNFQACRKRKPDDDDENAVHEIQQRKTKAAAKSTPAKAGGRAANSASLKIRRPAKTGDRKSK